MNLAANLVRTAEAHPDNVAVRLDDATLTYAQLEQSTRLMAGLLTARGVRPGDRVGIMLPNVPHWAVIYYGVLRAGAIAVPMNPLLVEREVAHYLTDSGATLVFAWHGFLDEAQAGASLAGADVQCVDPVGSRHSSGRAPRWTAWSSLTTRTRPSCSTPPAPRASPRVPSSPTATSPATWRSWSTSSSPSPPRT